MKKTILLLCFLCCFGCSSGNNDNGQDAGPGGVPRYKDYVPGPNVPAAPRAGPTCISRQHDSRLHSAEQLPRSQLHGRLRKVSSLGPGNPYPTTEYTTLRRALALRLPKSPSTYEPGCADGTREGFLSLPAFPDIAACDGNLAMHRIDSPEANAYCAPGWHVCSPVTNPTDAAIVGAITYLEATLPGGCFGYNAAQNGDSCIACTGDPGARQMAGVGKDCNGGNYDPAGSGCTADGRVDSHDAEGTIGMACGGGFTDGVVCCSSGTGAGSTPAECPTFFGAPGQERALIFDDCGDFCRASNTYNCNQQFWPDGYPVNCTRDGFEWACLEGATCDMTTPIDFYAMLYTPDVYCIFDPDTCPAEFPDLCGSVCCRSGAPCLAGAHCLDACPPGYPTECHMDGRFSGCCLEGQFCGNSCGCPGLEYCAGVCCPSGQVCRDDICYSSSCDSGSDYSYGCGDLCCLSRADCLSSVPPGVCGCPPDLPLECGEFCCSAGSTCDNGVCVPPCGGDYPQECLTDAQELFCCLDGATCQPDGCTCSPNLPVECNQMCAEAGTQDVDGECLIVDCGWGQPCGNFCCDRAECIQPGECGCPADFPFPCDDFCCLDGCTCDPKDCSGGCSGDFPDYCATGLYEPECCPAGATCRDPGGCACPADYPQECDQICCPEKTRCQMDDCVPISCPADYPVDCDHVCCREGAECLPDNECGCPDDYPLECAGFCCPEGWSCEYDESQGIERYICKKPPDPNGGTCPGGWKGSTATYGAVGISDDCLFRGETDVCITKEMYEQGTGLPFPASCAPNGTTGCLNYQGILVKPCCPGLTCVFRERCDGPGDGQCKTKPQ